MICEWLFSGRARGNPSTVPVPRKRSPHTGSRTVPGSVRVWSRGIRSRLDSCDCHTWTTQSREGLINLKLSAPKTLTFLIAVALIVFGILAEFTSIVDVSGDTGVLALAGGGVLLAIGCLFRGI